jgi:hypothetical protein
MIAFDNLADKNELALKVRSSLNQAQAASRNHGIELDEKIKLVAIYKANLLEFRISWAVALRLVETWWLGHEASTVSDMNHSSVDIKSPPC